jgi:hypothetical protein
VKVCGREFRIMFSGICRDYDVTDTVLGKAYVYLLYPFLWWKYSTEDYKKLQSYHDPDRAGYLVNGEFVPYSESQKEKNK